MASLLEISELAYRQLFPNPNDEANITLAEFIATAKVEYAYRLWEMNRAELQQTGENNIPSNLLSFTTLIVEKGKANIKDLKALRSLPNNTWIQSLGGIACGDCRYVLMDMNKWKLLCDDDSRGDNKAAIPAGAEILFPDGTFEKDGKVEMLYANMGHTIDGQIEVEDAVGGLIRRSLIDIYSKRFPEDKTNNSNSNGSIQN